MAHALASALLLLALAVELLRDAAALRVAPQGVTPLSHQELSETERLQQVWTIAADGDSSLQSIVAGVACQVYVSFAPATSRDAVATVRVVGDNAQIMEKTVTASSSSDGELRLHAPTVVDPVIVEGHVRVEIVVHAPEVIHSIQASGSGDVVVDNRVLFASKPELNLTAHASSSGDLYLPPQLHVNANALQLTSSGSGSIHAVASAVFVNDVEIHVTGSGDVLFGANSLQTSRSISVASGGAGATDLFFTRLSASQLFVKTSGSGDVKIARDAATGGAQQDLAECALKTSGSANIRADSMVCTSAHVVTSGSGDISLTAGQSLACKASGSGKISTHTVPPTTPSASGCKVHTLPGSAMPETQPTWMYAYSLPQRSSQAIQIFGAGSPGREDSDKDRSDQGEYDEGTDSATEENPSSTQYWCLWKPVLVVVLTIVVLALWQRRNSNRSRRHKTNEKTPLLRENDRVYI